MLIFPRVCVQGLIDQNISLLYPSLDRSVGIILFIFRVFYCVCVCVCVCRHEDLSKCI